MQETKGGATNSTNNDLLKPENSSPSKSRRKEKVKSSLELSNKFISDPSDSNGEKSEKKKNSINKRKSIPTNQSILLDDRYELNSHKIIGKGSHGEVYLGLDIHHPIKRYVAIKFDTMNSEKLKLEKDVLEIMNKTEGFPRLYSSGESENKFYIIEELLGPNLEELFRYCNGHFSLQTILLIGIQILTRLNDLHTKSNFIYCDIKPENFVIGAYKTNIIFMVDFGLCKSYKQYNNNQEHIPYQENIYYDGDTRFASINRHMGVELSRRDDLESLGYMLIYFANKKLPWEGSNSSDRRDMHSKALEKKMTIPVEVICKDLPLEFSMYMNYVKNLKFNEKPDYNFLKDLLAELLFTYYIEKFYFDWNLPSPIEIPSNIRINKDINTKSLGDELIRDTMVNKRKPSLADEEPNKTTVSGQKKKFNSIIHNFQSDDEDVQENKQSSNSDLSQDSMSSEEDNSDYISAKSEKTEEYSFFDADEFKEILHNQVKGIHDKSDLKNIFLNIKQWEPPSSNDNITENSVLTSNSNNLLLTVEEANRTNVNKSDLSNFSHESTSLLKKERRNSLASKLAKLPKVKVDMFNQIIEFPDEEQMVSHR